jgi:hypothetical protein
MPTTRAARYRQCWPRASRRWGAATRRSRRSAGTRWRPSVRSGRAGRSGRGRRPRTRRRQPAERQPDEQAQPRATAIISDDLSRRSGVGHHGQPSFGMSLGAVTSCEFLRCRCPVGQRGVVGDFHQGQSDDLPVQQGGPDQRCVVLRHGTARASGYDAGGPRFLGERPRCGRGDVRVPGQPPQPGRDGRLPARRSASVRDPAARAAPVPTDRPGVAPVDAACPGRRAGAAASRLAERPVVHHGHRHRRHA